MLLLLHGPETYNIVKRVCELKEEASLEGRLIQDIDCKESDVREVFFNLNTSSLFETKKLLIFRDAFGVKEFEEKEVQDILKKAELHTLVFTATGVKKTNPFFAFLLVHGDNEEFVKLKGVELKRFVEGEIKKQGGSFTKEALDELLFSCGDDLGCLAKEILKLTTYKYSSKEKEVTKEDVQLLAAKELQPKIFATIDAIATRNRKLAVQLLSRHLATGEAPLQLLSMFAWQFRTLLSVKDLMERRAPVSAIAQKLKLHPFVLQKSLSAAKQFSLEELKDVHRRIFSLDRALKTGRGNPEQLLYLFVASAAGKKSNGPSR
ncbi:MAG: DNA polymerase III subunit delta [bacterium]|nr:DNA polymerase III subunit delta [bacterium]